MLFTKRQTVFLLLALLFFGGVLFITAALFISANHRSGWSFFWLASELVFPLLFMKSTDLWLEVRKATDQDERKNIYKKYMASALAFAKNIASYILVELVDLLQLSLILIVVIGIVGAFTIWIFLIDWIPVIGNYLFAIANQYHANFRSVYSAFSYAIVMMTMLGVSILIVGMHSFANVEDEDIEEKKE